MDLQVLQVMIFLVSFYIVFPANVPGGLYSDQKTDDQATLLTEEPLQQDPGVKHVLDLMADFTQQINMLKQSQNEVQELLKRFSDFRQLLGEPSTPNSHETRHRRDAGQSFPTGESIDDIQNGRCQQSIYSSYMGQCILCPSGVVGPPGPPGVGGAQGPPGDVGRDGRDGRDWTPLGLNGDYADDIDNTSPQTPANYSGSVYVRWGQPNCPSSSELVYSGIAGGAWYTHKGSGSNYLCLPEEPIYDEAESSADTVRGLVYGAEYQTNTYQPYSSLYQHDVPCAVCKARSRQSLLMIPARNDCPDPSWTLEYHGHLMSEKYDHYRTEFVCVDRDAVAIDRTSANNNGALFFPVEGRCTSTGGLPCGPYVHGYELTCAVCTI